MNRICWGVITSVAAVIKTAATLGICGILFSLTLWLGTQNGLIAFTGYSLLLGIVWGIGILLWEDR